LLSAGHRYQGEHIVSRENPISSPAVDSGRLVDRSDFAADSTSAVQPNFHPVLDVRPAGGAIEINGDLTDPGWANAAQATGFVEVNPGDNLSPAVQSAAWVTFTESHLYVAMIAWDDPGQVRASLSDRDAIFSDDYFGILFDTYGDFSWGYEIFVNPLGIQGDLRIMSNGNEDISLDLVFESRGIVTDSGYQVELAIPFASLRFPDKPEQTWRWNFWRDRQRDNRFRYSWTAQSRDNDCFVCQWGTLNGLKDVKPAAVSTFCRIFSAINPARWPTGTSLIHGSTVRTPTPSCR